MSHTQPHPVLLYDGLCGLCDGVVQLVLARDSKRTLYFAPLQGEFASGVLSRHPALGTVDSLIVVLPCSPEHGELVLIRSDAAVYVGRYLGGVWGVFAAVVRVAPKFVRDAGYNVIARVRYRIFGKRSTCRFPSSTDRIRFLE